MLAGHVWTVPLRQVLSWCGNDWGLVACVSPVGAAICSRSLLMHHCKRERNMTLPIHACEQGPGALPNGTMPLNRRSQPALLYHGDYLSAGGVQRHNNARAPWSSRRYNLRQLGPNQGRSACRGPWTVQWPANRAASASACCDTHRTRRSAWRFLLRPSAACDLRETQRLIQSSPVSASSRRSG